MEKRYITANDLAIILGTYKSTVYYIMHPDKKREVALKKAKKENRALGKNNHVLNDIDFIKDNNNISIDIDNFLDEHKLSKSFKFKGNSFLDRMKDILDINKFPEYLTTKQLIEITNFNLYKIKKARAEVEYIIKIDEKYPTNAKGRKQYLYNKNSLIEYMNKYNIPINNKLTYKITKQFYSPKEIKLYLYNNYGIKKSMSTIYRRILVTKEIPAIRFGYMLKIPIIEFKELDLKSIFM